ncbi:MAG: glycosyltransferase family 2 protein [Sphaerochaetaceae bacterium]
MAFFSIIIPVFNAEKYLQNCIISVINQTFKDYELILVNDGSSDGSGKICDSYASQFPGKIKVTHTPNQGALFARRVGMACSKGEFIWIIDADDQILNNDVLSELKISIDKSRCDFLFFNAIKDRQTQIGMFDYGQFIDGQVFLQEDKYKLYELLITTRSFNTLWNKVFKKDLIDLDVDYSKYNHIVNGNDVFQVLPIVTNAKKIIYIAENFYFYNEVQYSSVRRFNPYSYIAIRENGIRLSEYADLWGLSSLQKNIDAKVLSGIASVVYKIRYMSAEQRKTSLVPYLDNIRTDEYFQALIKRTNRHNMNLFKWIIVYMVYHKWYRLLAWSIFSIGFVVEASQNLAQRLAP